MEQNEFFLGAMEAYWLGEEAFEGIPLFVSRNRVSGWICEVKARTNWILDSAAFTEIERHGKWTMSPRQYATLAAKCQRDIGRMAAAAIQDWMVEDAILKKTGRCVREHQLLTTRSLFELLDHEPGVPWMPVLQGQTNLDYLRHIDLYDHCGIDLTKQPVVGVGSVCTRQDTTQADILMKILYRMGIRVHAFGYSLRGLSRSAPYLRSSDSMAWSFLAMRQKIRMPGCTHSYPVCTYCPAFARHWRRTRVLPLLRTLS